MQDQPSRLAPVALRPVGIVAGTTAAVLLAVSGRYGWHRDELYFRVAGQHLAWGYRDQPPLTPLLARVAEEVAPGNLTVLRILPAVAVMGTILLGALVVRELGGTRGAQVLSAGVIASGGFVLGSGHLHSTATYDLAFSMAIVWLVIRLLRTEDPRWWLAVGAVGGVAMLNKNLIVLLVAALGVGLLAERSRRLLLSPWLVAGAVAALAVAAPNLIWQAQHGWPQFEMAQVLSERLGTENRVLLLPLQVVFVGPFFVGFGWSGVRRLRRDETFGALLWAWPAGLGLLLVTGGRPYYAVPLTTVVVLAGVARLDGATDVRARFVRTVLPNAVFSLVFSLPVLPLGAVPFTSALNNELAESVGWEALATTVAEVVASLPADERDGTVLLTGTYGEAGALDLYGPGLGLPVVYSPHNSFADFRVPDDEGATIVAVRVLPEWLEPHVERCEQVALVDNGVGVDNEVQGSPVLVCRGLRGTWAEVWETLRFLS